MSALSVASRRGEPHGFVEAFASSGLLQLVISLPVHVPDSPDTV
jgi:hypothetical protein